MKPLLAYSEFEMILLLPNGPAISASLGPCKQIPQIRVAISHACVDGVMMSVILFPLLSQ
jgi:hypothetical protein